MNNMILVNELFNSQFNKVYNPILNQNILSNMALFYPKMHSILYENNINYIQYSMCLNGKLAAILHHKHCFNLCYYTSNIIPTNPAYDFFIKPAIKEKLIFYQMKHRYTVRPYSEKQINDMYHKYLENKENVHLQIDVSNIENLNKQNNVMNSFRENIHLINPRANNNVSFVTENFFNTDVLDHLESSDAIHLLLN